MVLLLEELIRLLNGNASSTTSWGRLWLMIIRMRVTMNIPHPLLERVADVNCPGDLIDDSDNDDSPTFRLAARGLSLFVYICPSVQCCL